MQVFTGPLITPEVLAAEDNYVLTLSIDCARCKKSFSVIHDPGAPSRNLQVPYTASVDSTRPECGDTSSIDFVVRTLPVPDKFRPGGAEIVGDAP
jgi:hypothetical protein